MSFDTAFLLNLLSYVLYYIKLGVVCPPFLFWRTYDLCFIRKNVEYRKEKRSLKFLKNEKQREKKNSTFAEEGIMGKKSGFVRMCFGMLAIVLAVSVLMGCGTDKKSEKQSLRVFEIGRAHV